MLVSLSSWLVCRGWWVSHSNGKNNRDKNNLNLKCNKFFCSVHFEDIASHVNTIADPNMLHCNVFMNKILTDIKWKIFYLLTTDLLVLHLKKTFDCITTSGIVYLDCHFPNIVYVNTFSRYSPQYAVEIG